MEENTDYTFESYFDTYSDVASTHCGSSSSTDSEFECEEGATIPKKNFDDFQILSPIGEGAYGKVYQVRCRTNGKVYALKVLKKEHLAKTRSISNTLAERNIMIRTNHPFIVDLYCTFQSPERVGFVMKFIAGGQLFFHLRKEGLFSEESVRFYAAELVLALEYLHSHNIIHRDLKPENILISSTGHVALTDFGLAKEDVDEESRANTFCGTIEYMSPEMIKGQPYGKATDWWSVGILLFDMLSGNPPFRNKNRKRLQDDILTKKIKMSPLWQPATHSILKTLIERDVLKRIQLEAIKQHSFFKGMSWEALLKKDISPPFHPHQSHPHDTSNFDTLYTLQGKSFSPANPLSNSQNDLFRNFSYMGRDFTPSTPELHKGFLGTPDLSTVPDKL